jgi:hypothetical protein
MAVNKTVSSPVSQHILEISRLNGTPWVNPPFDTSDPNWSSKIIGGKTFDGSSSHALEWVSVLNPSIEQDDEVGLAGTMIDPDLSGNDLPFTSVRERLRVHHCPGRRLHLTARGREP